MAKIEIACIIEDNPGTVFWMNEIMKEVNFCGRLLIFQNGKEALDQLKLLVYFEENLPDIIFLDLNMPVMDGWEFLDEFTHLRLKKEIIIYIVTSSNDPADIERAHNYRMVSNYIVKPVTAENLKEIMDGG